MFADSCEKVCDLESFVEMATAEGRHGLSTIYFRRNLFHQSKPGRDVELQNTTNAPFKSLRDVMQTSKLSMQFGLGPELVD